MSGTSILLSARDPAAADNIAVLTRWMEEDPRFDPELVAAPPALERLRESGRRPRSFRFPGPRHHVPSSGNPDPLLQAAEELLREVEPEAVVVGLSSPGGGVDEALLATADVPTFALQDFWGDVNTSLGVPADTYLVLDQEAARMTKHLYGAQAVPVGSPKHAPYEGLDVEELRRKGRGALGVSEVPVVGFFGQSPDIPGHGSVARDLAKALVDLESPPTLLVRNHPKHPGAVDVDGPELSPVRDAGLQVVDITGEADVEIWLATSDVVTTPASLCGLDHAFLSAESSTPLGVTVYVQTSDRLQEELHRRYGLARFPIVDRGLGEVVRESDQLRPCLEQSLTSESRERYHENAKRGLPTKPYKRIRSALLERLENVD